MSMDVLTRSRGSYRRTADDRTGGWLVLHRRLREAIQLSAADDSCGDARITLLDTEPLTLGIDLAGVGTVQLSLYPQQSGVKFSIRAADSVRITREELLQQ